MVVLSPRQSARFVLSFFVAIAALSVLIACTEPNPAYVEPALCEVGESLYSQRFQAVHPDRLDVVFVVDSTNEAAGLRASLREAAPAVIQALDRFHYRVGVTTTEAGGILYRGGGAPCTDTGYVHSTMDDPEGALACLLSVGEDDTALPAALEVAIVAGTSSANPGFLRPEARLLIITVSAHDDCSSGNRITWPNINDCEWSPELLVDPTDLADKLRRLKPDRNGVALVAITGPNDNVLFSVGNTPTAACISSLGEILHGNRYHAVGDAMSPWSYNASACTDNIEPALLSGIHQLGFASESRYCLGKEATRGVRSVEFLAYDTPEAGVMLSPNAEDGFAYLGHSDSCETGEVSLGLEGRQQVTASSAFNVLFCGL